MTRLRLLAVLALAGVALAGCGDDDADVSSGDDRPGRTSLAGEYLSVEVAEDGTPRPLAPGTQIRLTFDGTSVRASLGCNHLGGTSRLDGEVLVVDDLSTTAMGCDPPLHDQDQWFAALLTSRPTVAVDGATLTLTSGSTVVVLRDREAADPDRELVGTTWEVDGFLEGTGPDGTAMSMPRDRPGTLLLRDDGLVTGHDGCNGFGFGGPEGEEPEGLRYEVEGDRITFTGDPVSTLIGCDDLQDDVGRYWVVLSGTVSWSIEADRLTLLAGGGRGVTYRAVEE
jgi:heat shock protein HslJ